MDKNIIGIDLGGSEGAIVDGNKVQIKGCGKASGISAIGAKNPEIRNNEITILNKQQLDFLNDIKLEINLLSSEHKKYKEDVGGAIHDVETSSSQNMLQRVYRLAGLLNSGIGTSSNLEWLGKKIFSIFSGEG